MFIQVVRGKVKDAAALRAANESWKKELKPGAKGYLGSTSGVADDGTAVIVARFDSEASARANSERPEQGAWYEKEMSKVFEGDATFLDCPDVTLYRDGGSDAAGFVQVMFGKADDPDAYKKISAQFESEMPTLRPDVIGGMTGFASDGRFADVTYFTSEAEAREGEKKELPQEMQNAMKEFSSYIQEFVDLRDPWFDSA
jgi:hypothetical protein